MDFSPSQYIKINNLFAAVFSCVQLFMTPWTLAHQAPLSVEFSGQEYWIELPFPSPGDLIDPGIKPASPESPVLTDGFFTTAPPEKAHHLKSPEQFFQKEILF